MMAINGYVIPFDACDGLVYMDMCPPTDTELHEGPNQLPQLILMSDTKWILSCLDHKPDYDTYFTSVSDLHDLQCGNPFDDYGKYIDDPTIAALYHETYSCYDLSTIQLPDPPGILDSAVEARTIPDKPVDYLEYQPQIGWLNVDTIKHTFKNTTQYYKFSYSTLLHKTYSSPYPTYHVPCCNELIATDTVISDTLPLITVYK